MRTQCYIACCLITLLCVFSACEERQRDDKSIKPKLTDQDITLKTEELLQREMQLSKKAADIESLMIKLEHKENELLGKENRLLEFERKIQDEELQLIEKSKSMEKFRMTSWSILLLGVLFLLGGVILIYKAQQKKPYSDSDNYRKLLKTDAHALSAPDEPIPEKTKRRSRKNTAASPHALDTGAKKSRK